MSKYLLNSFELHVIIKTLMPRSILNCISYILAGIFISIGAYANLVVGGYLGPFLFAFGLIAVIIFRLSLFTGKYGFLFTRKPFDVATSCLLGNLIGVVIAGYTLPELSDTTNLFNILNARENASYFNIFLGSVFCGIIMSIAVRGAREEHVWYSLLIGVPLFIFCGFPHCIADGAYLIIGQNYTENDLWRDTYPTLPFKWAITIFGNWLGCCIPFIKEKFEDLS